MKKGTTKRLLALCTAVICCAACLTGCGKTAPTSSGGSTPATAPSAAGGGYKKEIIIGFPDDITTLDTQESNATANLIFQKCIHSTLIKLNADGGFDCALAESYKQLSEKVWEFKLRKDIKFHNGEAMTADDVVFTYERAKKSGAANDKVEKIVKITKIDDYTVQFELTDQISDILYSFAYPTLGILNRKAVEADGVKGPTIGAGPYVFDEWSNGNFITIHSFENYYEGKPKTQKITFRIMPESSARVISLQTGEIDICVEPPAIELAHIAADSKLSLLQVAGEKMDYLAFNMTWEPFASNQLLRQAIATAINKDDIIAVATEGLGTPASTFFSPGFGRYDGYAKYAYNPEKAKELLAQAGYANGFAFTLYYNGSMKELMAQVIQSQLSKIGVTVKIEELETAALKAKLHDGDFQAVVYNWANDSSGPDNNVRPILHTGSGSNRTHYSDKKLDEMMDVALCETDVAKREELYKEIQIYVMDQCPLVPCLYETISVGVNAKLKGFTPDTSSLHNFATCYIEE